MVCINNISGNKILSKMYLCRFPNKIYSPRGQNLISCHSRALASMVAQMVKSLPAMQETPSLILGLGRSPGEWNGSSLQYFCLENPMDRGAWWATVNGVPKKDMTSD